ncbi:hypothetical protein Bca4012_054802 [Brassica carinata]
MKEQSPETKAHMEAATRTHSGTEQSKRENRSTPKPKSRPPMSHRCYNCAVPPQNAKTHGRKQPHAKEVRRRSHADPENTSKAERPDMTVRVAKGKTIEG